MNRIFILIALLQCSFLFNLAAQAREDLYDGPYVFTTEDSLRIRWISAGQAHDTTILRADADLFTEDGLPQVDLTNLDLLPAPETAYEDNGKVVALSDVHGQFDVMIELLKNHNIIDAEGHWAYGDGQLVILGDNMGRGDKVTEILWFLFFLEKEAAAVGGKVHVTLGNHEVMVITGDLRYIHRKYVLTSALFTEPYQNFYRPGTVLGDWMRQQNVALRIGDNVFIHAGVSPDLQKYSFSPKQINKAFRNKILAAEVARPVPDERLDYLEGGEGPLWYRGYFEDPPLSDKEFAKTLKKWKAERLIIGHTSQEQIESRYDGRLIIIDCSIKLGESGQLLKLLPDGFKVGEYDGSDKLLYGQLEDRMPKRTLFDFLYEAEQPSIRITTNSKQLIKRKQKEEYQPANYTFAVGGPNAFEFALEGRLRARGNTRKKVCYYPPLKLDLNKKDLDSLGYLKLDKLKIVLPCRTGKRSQQLLFKEQMVYELYEAIDTNYILTRLIDFVIEDGDKELFSGKALLVEHEDHYRLRKNAELLERGGVALSILDREVWTKMRFFQYMVGNTDWSIFNRHNVEIVKLADGRIIPVPYDFDYCGFVGQGYAVPHPSLPIESVQDRYFKRGPITESEFDQTLKYYLSMEEALLNINQQATYLDDDARFENKKFLEDFFRVLRRPREMKYQALDFEQ